MSIALTFGQSAYALESPVVQGERETITYACTFLGAKSVSSPSAVAYRSRTSQTGTVFPAGSITASGNVVTLKPLKNLVGGIRYVIAVTATVDGNTLVRKFEVIGHADSMEA